MPLRERARSWYMGAMKKGVCYSLLLAGLGLGCDHKPPQAGVTDDVNQRQVTEYDAQSKIVDDQLARSEEQMVRNERLLQQTEKQALIAEEQSMRLEKLIAKWEDQARRQDALLDKQEEIFKRLGEVVNAK